MYSYEVVVIFDDYDEARAYCDEVIERFGDRLITSSRRVDDNADVPPRTPHPRVLRVTP